MFGMIVVAPKDLLTFLKDDVAHGIPPGGSLRLSGLFHGAADYFTAPKVRPRTSCFWLNQPMMRIGAMASVEAADSFAQNNP